MRILACSAFCVLCKDVLFFNLLLGSAAVEDLTNILGVPREDLNITTMSGKGRVAGHLSIYNPKHGRWLDCTKEVYSVSGDLHELRCRSCMDHVRLQVVTACESVAMELS